MVKYRAKIGWVIILAIAVLLLCFVRAIMIDSFGVRSILLLSTCVFIVYLVLCTYYEIGEGMLWVKSSRWFERPRSYLQTRLPTENYGFASNPARSNRASIFGSLPLKRM